ncbi:MULTISPECIES: HEAT repeat domain-containing protein [unclassified Streptomyces]|uniref:HEAT repeat domain-containing protein n=1 Tax=unclassified Streptomyces TaxID=2593676 RepID=UPI0036E7ABD4
MTESRASGDRSVAVGRDAGIVITGNENTIRVDPQVPPAPAPPSPEEVDAAVAHYARRIARVHGHPDLELLTLLSEEHPSVDLRELFVAPTVRANPPAVELPRELLRKLEESGHLPDPDALLPGVDSSSLASRESYLRRPAQEVLGVLAAPANRLLVILGDPGAGKSTLIRYLSLTLALGRAEGSLAALSDRVPVVVELRQYAEERWRHSSFEDYLADQYQDFDRSVPGPVLEELLASGRALVVFDGLDELFDLKVRAETAERIAAFASRRPSARIVVTSRVIGYERLRAVLDREGFAHFMLQDLDEDRIREFIRGWYRVSCPDAPVRAAQLAGRLTSAVTGSRPLQEMAGNPLLLTVLATIGRHQTLPHSRRSVFEQAVTVLVSQWDQAAKRLMAPLTAPVAEALDVLGPDQRLELLRLLARTMQEGHSRIAGNHIHGSDLERVFRDYLRKYELSPVHATAAARDDRAAARAELHPVPLRRRGVRLRAPRVPGVPGGGRHRPAAQRPGVLADAGGPGRAGDRPARRRPRVARGAPPARRPARYGADRHGHRSVAGAELRNPCRRRRPCCARPADAGRVEQGARAVRELSARSTAVVDAATLALDVRGRKGPWLLDEALPALAAFSPHWTGKRRFLRWFRISGQFSPSEEPTLVACALRLGVEELAALARRSYYGIDRMFFLYTWAGQHPDDSTVGDLLRHIAVHDPDGDLRSSALEVMADVWPEPEDVRALVAARAHDDPEEGGRYAALRYRARVWPDEAGSLGEVERAAVEAPDVNYRIGLVRALGRAAAANEHIRRFLTGRGVEDPDRHVRRNALSTLGEYCSEHQDVLDLISRRMVEAVSAEERHAAMWILGEYWSADKRARTLLLQQAADTDRPHDRASALTVLGSWGPDDEDLSQAIVQAATDAEAAVRKASVEALRNRRIDREDLQELVLHLALADPDAGVRRAAIDLIDRDRFDHDAGREALAAAVGDADQIVRDSALFQLAQQWPDHPEARDVLIEAAAGDLPAHTRPSVLRGLMAHWSDRDDVHQQVLRALDLPDRIDHGLVLQLFEEDWPDWDDVRAAVIRLATRPADGYDTRRYALRTLAKRWFDREDAREVVRRAAMDSTAPASAIPVLRQHGARPDDVRTLFAHVAQHHDQEDARYDAVRALGLRWPDDPDIQALFLRLATDDPAAYVRFTALRRWALSAGDEEASAVAAARATADPDARVRGQILHMLAMAWPSSPETVAALRDCAEHDADEETRRRAADLLSQLTD